MTVAALALETSPARSPRAITARSATRPSRTRRCASRRASSSRWSGRPAAASPRLLNVGAGLLAPSSGTVSVFGEPLNGHQPARRLHVPGRRADAVALGDRQRDGRPRVSRRAAGRSAQQGRRVAEARRPRRFRRPLSASAVGRHAQARRDGADADSRPRHHPDGRAVFRARYPDASADGKRVARPVGRQTQGGAVHHARSRRSDRDVRSRGGAVGGTGHASDRRIHDRPAASARCRRDSRASAFRRIACADLERAAR